MRLTLTRAQKWERDLAKAQQLLQRIESDLRAMKSTAKGADYQSICDLYVLARDGSRTMSALQDPFGEEVSRQERKKAR